MYYHHGCDDKGKEEVEGKESGKCGFVNGESPSDSFYEAGPNIGNG